MPPPLTPKEAKTLELAARTYRHESSREDAVWQELHVSLPVFWSRVTRLIDMESAIAHSPADCARLRRVRAARLRVA